MAGGGAYLPVELGGGVELLRGEYLREAGGMGVLLRAGAEAPRDGETGDVEVTEIPPPCRRAAAGRCGGTTQWRGGRRRGQGDPAGVLLRAGAAMARRAASRSRRSNRLVEEGERHGETAAVGPRREGRGGSVAPRAWVGGGGEAGG
jgi:hypothetical protein